LEIPTEAVCMGNFHVLKVKYTKFFCWPS